MKLEVGKLYKILEDSWFVPENYLDYGVGSAPEFLVKKDSILLCTKIRIDPTPFSQGDIEAIFLFGNHLLIAGESKIDNNPEDYFERVL